MKLSIYPNPVPELRMSGALPPIPPGNFMACIRTTSQLPLPFTPHIQVTGITAPELRHKAVMGKERPEENKKKVHRKEFDNLYCTCRFSSG
jgi:hypothetical protein